MRFLPLILLLWGLWLSFIPIQFDHLNYQRAFKEINTETSYYFISLFRWVGDYYVLKIIFSWYIALSVAIYCWRLQGRHYYFFFVLIFFQLPFMINWYFRQGISLALILNLTMLLNEGKKIRSFCLLLLNSFAIHYSSLLYFIHFIKIRFSYIFFGLIIISIFLILYGSLPTELYYRVYQGYLNYSVWKQADISLGVVLITLECIPIIYYWRRVNCISLISIAYLNICIFTIGVSVLFGSYELFNRLMFTLLPIRAFVVSSFCCLNLNISGLCVNIIYIYSFILMLYFLYKLAFVIEKGLIMWV